jgi:hypothetical protein
MTAPRKYDIPDKDLEDLSNKEIRVKYGIGERTLSTYRQERGIPSPKQGRPFNSVPVDVPQAIDQAKVKEHYQARISILERTNLELIKQSNTTDAILKRLTETIQAFPKARVPAKHLPSTHKSTEILNLSLSDLHSNETVDFDETGGLAQYNFGIFTRRMDYLAQSILSIKSKLTGYNLPHLNIHALGDMGGGEIHEELSKTNDGTLVDMTFGTAFVLAQFCLDLLSAFETIDMDCVVGNHGRMTVKPAFKQRYVNWDYIIYQTLSLMLINEPRVKFNIPKSFWTIKELGDKRVLLLHGDNIKSWMGVPWYGIERAAAKLQQLLAANNQFFDYIELAHFHRTGEIQTPGGAMFINGSAIGGNDFSLGAMFASGEPQQTLKMFNPRHNRMNFRWPLSLSDGDKLKTCRYNYSSSIPIAEQVREVI